MSYNFDDKFGLDLCECKHLEMFCRQKNISSALEFGPGNSTQAMLDGNVGWIESYEQSDVYCQLAIERFKNKFVVIRKYNGSEFPISTQTQRAHEFAFIDGPSGHTVKPARLNSALFCFARCKLIGIHDSKRDVEAVNILLDLGMHVVDQFDSDRGIIFLER